MRIILALTAILAMTLPNCTESRVQAAQNASQTPKEKAVPIAAARVTIGDAVATYTTTSTLEPEQSAEIWSRTTGVVRQIWVEEGDVVEKDQLLLNLEDDDQQLRLKQAEIRLLQAEAEYARHSKMKSLGVLAEEDYELTENALQQAKADLELAQLSVSYTQVKAPFSGRIVLRHVDVGANVTQGTPLFEIMDFEPLLVKIHIPSERLGLVAPGQPLRLTRGDGNENLQAKVRLVSPIVDPGTGTVKVTAEIHQYPMHVRPGDFVQAYVMTDRRASALKVPSVAVFEEQGRKILYVVEDQKAVRRVVQTGYVDDAMTEILSGITAEDLIIIKGQRNLRDGSPVEILEGPAEEASI